MCLSAGLSLSLSLSPYVSLHASLSLSVALSVYFLFAFSAQEGRTAFEAHSLSTVKFNSFHNEVPSLESQTSPPSLPPSPPPLPSRLLLILPTVAFIIALPHSLTLAHSPPAFSRFQIYHTIFTSLSSPSPAKISVYGAV